MNHHDQSLSSADLNRLRELVYQQAGINLGPDKRVMLELRLRPRLRHLRLSTFSDYCKLLHDPRQRRQELVHFLDAVTTNKTDFFREPGHFEFLTQKALPATGVGYTRPLFVWCSASSTGEEPYTLAMVLQQYAEAHPGFRFRILATDLSTKVLEKANLAIYPEDVVAPIPIDLRRKYFMRSTDREDKRFRVTRELRNLVEFRQLNLMDKDYGVAEPVDMLFCRNVLIYFDRPTQEAILRKLTRCIVPGGFLYLGHSETIHGLDLPLSPVAPALYRKLHA